MILIWESISIGYSFTNYFSLIPISGYLGNLNLLSKIWVMQLPESTWARPLSTLLVFFMNGVWAWVLFAYFVIDQPELRALGWFKDDAKYVTSNGMIISWSIPILFPFLYIGYVFI